MVTVLVLQRVRMRLQAGQKLDDDGFPVHSAVVTLSPKYGIQAKIWQRQTAA